jgi:UDP-glucose 4-epimerase
VKVLVTGSSGFIGRAVAAELESKGHTMVPFDRPEHDVMDRSLIEQVIDTCGVTGIINLAGKLGTPELFGHEAEAAMVNVIGALNVFDAASARNLPCVQVGTGHKGQPNPYAITKGCAEDLVLARAQWKGERFNVVRAFHAYGPHQVVGPPHGTASVHKFFPTFACRALTGMDLELCGRGDQMIDPVHVDDCARVLVRGLSEPYGRVLEAGNGVAVSVREVAVDIAKAAGGSFSTTDAAQRDGEPRGAWVVADDPMCYNVWPYKVEETVEWYRKWLLSSR